MMDKRTSVCKGGGGGVVVLSVKCTNYLNPFYETLTDSRSHGVSVRMARWMEDGMVQLGR